MIFQSLLRGFLVFTLAVPALAEPGTSPPSDASGADEILAVYEGGAVTRGQYESWLLFLDKPEEAEKRVERIASIAMLEFQAAAAEAAGLGRDQVSQMAMLDSANRYLERELRRHLAERIEVGSEELDRAVEERKDDFFRPKRVRLSNLLKRFPKGSDESQKDALRQRMEAIRRELLEGADFAELAQRESDSQTRFRGGLIGWVRPGDMAPEIERLAMAMQPGDLSPVLATDDGLTILRCEAIEEEQRPPLAQIRQRVEKNLREERLAEHWSAIEERAAAVSIDLEAARSGGDRPVLELPGTLRLSGAEARALLQVRGIRVPEGGLPPLRLENLLRGFVEQHLAAEKARALGLDRTPEARALMEWSRRSQLATEWTKSELKKRFVPLQEEEIRAYYDANRERYRRPPQIHLEVIAIPAERSELRRLFQQGEALVEEIRSGRSSFAEVARLHSRHSSAAKGGRVGWLDRTQIAAMGRNVLATVEELEPGEVSGLVQQPEGMSGASNLWILRKLESRPAKRLSYEEAAVAAENGLGNERTRALQAEIRREVLEKLQLRRPGAEPDQS